MSNVFTITHELEFEYQSPYLVFSRFYAMPFFEREIIDITSLESVNKVNLWSHQVNYNYQKPRYIYV